MQRAGQHLPGPFAADMSNRNRIACIGLRILRLANGRVAGVHGIRLRGDDAYRDGPSMGVVCALHSAFWSCSPCHWLSALSEL